MYKEKAKELQEKFLNVTNPLYKKMIVDLTTFLQSLRDVEDVKAARVVGNEEMEVISTRNIPIFKFNRIQQSSKVPN